MGWAHHLGLTFLNLISIVFWFPYLYSIYSNQTCTVRWGSSVSNSFQVKNGVRQGAVLSPILFCIYIDKLIKHLRASTIGCQLNGVYMGIWVYADDIILLAPCRSGLQQMTTICERYADIYDLKFSTNVYVVKSKTKCVIFSKTVIDVNAVNEQFTIAIC